MNGRGRKIFQNVLNLLCMFVSEALMSSCFTYFSVKEVLFTTKFAGSFGSLAWLSEEKRGGKHLKKFKRDNNFIKILNGDTTIIHIMKAFQMLQNKNNRVVIQPFLKFKTF